MIIVFLIGILLRVAFAVFTPTFYAPDEQPHFKYVQYLYEQKKLPVQVSKTNDPTNDWEYYQPPLYYLLLVPVYWLFDILSSGDIPTIVIALRIISIILSAIFLWFTIKILNNLELNELFVKTFIVSMVYLLPSYVFISSVINNDNLIIALSGAIIFFLTKNRTLINSIYIGLLLGFAFLIKLTAFILLLGIISFFTYHLIRKKCSLLGTLKHIVLVALISLFISLPMFLRNLHLYGDFIGESVANVRVTWPSWLYGFLATIKYMMDSFWASAGITYNIEFLSGFSLLLTAFIIVSLVYILLKKKNSIQSYLNSKLGNFLIPMLFTVFVEIFLIIRFGLLYEQGQGRFLYILLIPISILIAINIFEFEKVKKIRSHLFVLGFFILYNTSFLGYCIEKYISLG